MTRADALVAVDLARTLIYHINWTSGMDQEDFYMEDGNVVFTEAYHLKRGKCCGSGCRHCPYLRTSFIQPEVVRVQARTITRPGI